MKENEISNSEAILIEYLHAFSLPGKLTDSSSAVLKSSQDIQDDLSEMLEISLDEITSVMLSLRYPIKVDQDNRPKWVMLPV